MSRKKLSALERSLAVSCHPTYDVTRSYEWNYRVGPLFKGPFPPRQRPSCPIPFLDFQLASRLGVAAGPLLNSRWIRVYARLGFDLLTYKTVRSHRRPSNPKPNCLFIDTHGPITENRLMKPLTVAVRPPSSIRDITITNSFGIPSRDPSTWQEDIRRAKTYLDKFQVLAVSVVGTAEIYRDVPSFIRDFVSCAKLAQEAGADIVELDLSCPNSNAVEGMVYLDPKLSGAISKAVKAEIRKTPLFIKLGYFSSRDQFEATIRANAPYVEGVVGINTMKMTVLDATGRPALSNRPESGVCGAGIKPCALQFARWLQETKQENRYDFLVIGVGGIMTAEDIEEFLQIGIDAVEMATAAMWDPYLAYRYYLHQS